MSNINYTEQAELNDYEISTRDHFSESARIIQKNRAALEDNQALREEVAHLKAYIAGLQEEHESLSAQLAYRGGQSA